MGKKIISVVSLFLVLTMLVSCGGETYLAGEQTKTYEIGDLLEMPSPSELRIIGEKHSKSILAFNYLEDFPEKINVLNKEISEHNVKMGSEVGAAEILDTKHTEPGTVEIRYKSDINCVLDLTTNTFTSWIMPDVIPYSPPPPTEADQKTFRKLTPKIAEKIATEFLRYMQIPLDGFEVKVVLSETKIFADVYFFEEIEDNGLKSPNWIKVKVNFWGMIKQYAINVGPTPEITTKPTFMVADAIDFARNDMGFPDDFDVPQPERVILRKRFIQDEKVLAKDELAWFFSFIGVAGAKRGTLLLSAHTGEILEN